MGKYPRVGGDGGSVPFTPADAPAVTDELLEHIFVGKPRKKGGWDGGHGFGAGKGKSEFPQSWDRPKIRSSIERVLQTPDEIIRRGATLVFTATVDGLRMRVRVRGRQGPSQLWTAYPVSN